MRTRLFVLMILTCVVAPSMIDFVRAAQWVKANEDSEAIGVSVLPLTSDIGPCLKFDASGSCTKANRVDLLHSDGPDVTAADAGGEAAAGFDGGGTTAGPLNWHTDRARGDSMRHQFVANGSGPRYSAPADPGSESFAGPGAGWGWRGAHLSSPAGPDPRGQRYLVNTVFLAVARDAEPGVGAGQRSGGWSHDTFCISAGPNGQYETPFGGNSRHGVSRWGDDLVFIISGDTR